MTPSTPPRLRPALALWLGLWSGSAAAPAAAQAGQTEFAATVEMVTVDVVVLDRDGRPVTGLTRADFSVSEDGQPQGLQVFEEIDVAARRALPAPVQIEGVATNTAPAPQPQRVFVLAFDDAHLSAVTAAAARRAVQQFLGGGRDGDLVWLVSTTSGTGYQSTLPGGREELLAALDKLQGQRPADTSARRISDYEAMRVVQRDPQTTARVRKRLLDLEAVQDPEEGDPSGGPSAEKARDIEKSTGLVQMRAAEAYAAAVSRRTGTFTVLAHTLRVLEGLRARKTVLLLSEGFVEEATAAKRDELVDAARRANAVIYFLDARGLVGQAWTSDADIRPAADGRDQAAVLDDLRQSAAGADGVALDSGGFTLRNSNDLAGGLERIARESASYYLLGYEPANAARDGKFRKLSVSVSREGVEVRARRGYFAPTEAPKGRLAAAQLSAAAEAPFDVGGLPLRLASYVTPASASGPGSVLLAGEVALPGLGASLETLAVVQPVAGGEALRRERSLRPKPDRADPLGGAWGSLQQRFDLPAGVYDGRLVVRDPSSGRIGSVHQRFEVPPAGVLRVGTPILTDRLEEVAGGQVPVPLARRHFAPGSKVFGLFEVFGAAAGPQGPKVSVSYGVRAADGRVLGSRPAAALSPGPAGDLTQTLVLPLQGVPQGRYELVVEVRDELAGKALEVKQPFVVGDPATLPSPASAAASAGGRRDAAGYLALVGAYRAGDTAAAETLAGWTPAELKAGPEALRSGKDCDETCRRAAALLHLEAAVAANARGQAAAAAAQAAAGREILDRARGEAAFRSRWLLALGYDLLGQARLAEAEPVFDESAKAGLAEAWLALGAIWDFRSTLETLAPGAAVEAAPIGSQGLTRFQLQAQRERALAKAEECYRRALRARPDLAEAHLRLGRVLARRDKTAEAEPELKAGAAQGDQLVQLLAQLFLGDLAQARGQLQPAIEHFRQALQLDPRSQAARLALSYAVLRSGNRAAAAQLVREAASTPQQDATMDGWLAYHLGPSRHLQDLMRSLREELRS